MDATTDSFSWDVFEVLDTSCAVREQICRLEPVAREFCLSDIDEFFELVLRMLIDSGAAIDEQGARIRNLGLLAQFLFGTIRALRVDWTHSSFHV